MIEYVFENNIDDRVLNRASRILDEDGLVAFPTESNWSIGCSVNSRSGLEKLKKLKGKGNKYTFTVICSEISQIDQISQLNTAAFKIVKQYTPGPYVFILPAKKNIEKVINMKRAEVGVRIPGHNIPFQLIKTHGSPLFVITAAREMAYDDLHDDSYDLEHLFSFGWEVEDIEGVDVVLDTGEEVSLEVSTVVRLTDSEPEVIRQGAGLFE